MHFPTLSRHYKFVLDESNWHHDPRNPERVDDGHGGSNSILRLGAPANLSLKSVGLGDGVIDPARALFRQILGNGQWLVRYQALRGDLQGIAIVGEEHGEIRLTWAVTG